MERMLDDPPRAEHLADWALARGVSSMTTGDLSALLRVPEEQVRVRLRAPTSRGEWVTPTRGLWLPVPAEYRIWGAPPGSEVVDLLMRHLKEDYYVGWLTAAAQHGAGHHAPQVFQVACARHVRSRNVGRTKFLFQKRDPRRVPTVDRSTRSGSFKVSSVEATMLDLAHNIDLGGGLDNVATVIAELCEATDFDMKHLSDLAPSYPVSAVRRTGWIIENFTDGHNVESLLALAKLGASRPSRLSPHATPQGPVSSKWMLYLNREVEVDL